MNNTHFKTLSICFFVVVACCLHPKNASAQSRLEYGFSLGPSNFLGDLGGGSGKGQAFIKDNMIPLTRLMGGFHVGYYVLPFLNFELHAIHEEVDFEIKYGKPTILKDRLLYGFSLNKMNEFNVKT